MPQPLVTGIAPKEGYPGTKVTIRGEHLGRTHDDVLSVKICSVDCTLTAEWMGDKKIVAYTGFCKGKGDVIVVTRSGGVGSCSVGFQGLIKKNIGPTDESAVWIDEDPKSIITGLKKVVTDNDIMDNPLGICVEDGSHITTEYLDKEFGNCTADIRKESFNSIRFLLENYQNAKYSFFEFSGTSHLWLKKNVGLKTKTKATTKTLDTLIRYRIETGKSKTSSRRPILKRPIPNIVTEMNKDLKTGLTYLRSYAASKTTNSSDTLLKSNISSFMDAIRILKNIHTFSSDDKRNRFTKGLETMLHDIVKTSHKIYDQDLDLKIRADVIRNSLNILEEYKMVFELPQNIDKWIRKEEYESIINDYKAANKIISRAESLNSQLFSRVKVDIEQRIENVKSVIYAKLPPYNLPSSPDEKKILIDYIYSIDVTKDFDIGWFCLEEEKKWIINFIIELRGSHIAKEKTEIVLKEINLNESQTSQQQQSTQQLQVPQASIQQQMQKSFTDADGDLRAKPHERNKFIEDMCEMFLDVFTDFWNFSKMYLHGSLTPANDDIMLGINRPQTSKIKLRKTDHVYRLTEEVLNTFCNVVRDAFIPDDKSQQNVNQNEKALLTWPKTDEKKATQILTHCLRVCRMCASQIHALDIPEHLFTVLQQLIYDLRCECLRILFSTPTRDILTIIGFEEQDWVADRDSEIGAYTNMPIRFEAICLKAFTLSKEFVLEDKKGEVPLFRDAKFVNTVSMLIFGMIVSFLKRVKNFMTKEDKLPQFVDITRNKMLLYLYNNLTLCLTKILPNISSVLRQNNYKQIDSIMKETTKRVKELQTSILEQYMQETIQPIITSIDANVYIGKYDFKECSPPISVRNYIKTIIINLISVHAETFSINKSLINNIITYAVKEIFNELYKIFANIPQFSKAAAMQTFIDVFCLKETLKTYINDNNEIKQVAQKILDLIPKDSFQQNQKKMTEIINEFQTRMNPYILILQDVINV